MMSRVASCFGGSSFGSGIVPVRLTSCDITVSGVSVTAVAETGYEAGADYDHDHHTENDHHSNDRDR
jgi:hypothetical protein